MDLIFDTFRMNPALSIFLTLGLGYMLGKLRVGSFRLGEITGVLLAGVVIGQTGVKISPDVQTVFFLLFLFAVGYGVGPQFFQGLKKDGLPQFALALFICVACLITAFITARIFGFGIGYGPGLYAGACTMTSALGVSDGALAHLSLTREEKALYSSQMSVAFSITYICGMSSAVWFLTSIGPRLLGVNLQASCRALDEKLGSHESEPGVHSAYHEVITRAYHLDKPGYDGVSVAEFESRFINQRVFVERYRRAGKIHEAGTGTVLATGDVISVVSRLEYLIEDSPLIGTECDDRELQHFPAETVDVIITNKRLAGKTLEQIAAMNHGRVTRGVFIRSLTRGGHLLPFANGTRINRGDVIKISGAKRDIERTLKYIGYPDRQNDSSDVSMMGFAIFIGAFIGALTLDLHDIPLSLTTSGGALVSGLVLGWLRSVHPTFGKVPRPALWVLTNLGITAFIAVLGINAGPDFVTGLKEAGISLIFAGLIVSIIPLFLGVLFGRYILKLHPAIILGGCAGARGATAALSQLQDIAKSKTPALGYTIPYAVGNIIMAFWGLVIVLLLHR